MPHAMPQPLTGADQVIQCARDALESCAAVLDGLSASQYTRASEQIAGSTIGQHVRHTIDHFVAITAACASDPMGVIDYDHRERQTMIERDPAFALAAINRVRQCVESLSDEALAAPLCVRLMTSDRAGASEVDVTSTLARELLFASHHAVHHFAMIQAIAHSHGVTNLNLPEGFGKAPSTLRYEGDNGSGGKAQ